MAGIWRAYILILQRRPFLVQTSTTGTIVCCGDAIAQLVVERKGRQFDKMRSLRFATFGLFLLGPALRGWYILLDRVYKGPGTRTAMLKLVTDQAIFSPTFVTSLLCWMGYWKGQTTQQIHARVKRTIFAPCVLTTFLCYMSFFRWDTTTQTKGKLERGNYLWFCVVRDDVFNGMTICVLRCDLVPILKNNYKFWPFVQFVNFFYVPLQHRFLVVNCASLVWNTYLAWRAEKD